MIAPVAFSSTGGNLGPLATGGFGVCAVQARRGPSSISLMSPLVWALMASR